MSSWSQLLTNSVLVRVRLARWTLSEGRPSCRASFSELKKAFINASRAFSLATSISSSGKDGKASQELEERALASASRAFSFAASTSSSDRPLTLLSHSPRDLKRPTSSTPCHSSDPSSWRMRTSACVLFFTLPRIPFLAATTCWPSSASFPGNKTCSRSSTSCQVSMPSSICTSRSVVVLCRTIPL